MKEMILLNSEVIKTYSELISIPSFDDRISYLETKSHIGLETFGGRRLDNQEFYKSNDWKQIRRYVICRDMGYDLAHKDFEISKYDRIIIHHINPIDVDDIINRSKYLIDPEYLVTTTLYTHNLIHYGKENNYIYTERYPNDICPWKK